MQGREGLGFLEMDCAAALAADGEERVNPREGKGGQRTVDGNQRHRNGGVEFLIGRGKALEIEAQENDKDDECADKVAQAKQGVKIALFPHDDREDEDDGRGEVERREDDIHGVVRCIIIIRIIIVDMIMVILEGKKRRVEGQEKREKNKSGWIKKFSLGWQFCGINAKKAATHHEKTLTSHVSKKGRLVTHQTR